MTGEVSRPPLPDGARAAADPDVASRLGRVRQRVRRHGFGGFLARRVGSGLLGVWGAVTIVFVALLLTGNPAVLLVRDGASAEEIAAVEQRYGFDRPIVVQYGQFMWKMLTGNPPPSIASNTSSLSLVLDAVPASLRLAGAGLAIGLAVGLVVGYLSVFGRYAWFRNLPLVGLGVAQATPTFFVGALLVLVFGVRLKWFPTSGDLRPWSWVLPAVTMASFIAPPVARVFRASILSVRHELHVRSAYAKGLTEHRVRRRHIAANALVPVVTITGVIAGGLLGGAVVTETVFAWPGVGRATITAVNMRDYPVVISAVLLIAATYVTITLVADVIVALLDPRIGARP